MKPIISDFSQMRILNFINGQFVEPFLNHYIDNTNPATGEIYSIVPSSTHEDVENAVKHALVAQKSWEEVSTQEKSAILLRIADLMEKNTEKFALAESIDSGKPLSLAKKMDIPRAVENFRFFATAILHYSTQTHQTNSHYFNYTTRKPIGIIGCISPWNLPLYLFTWKIAPAIATGNAVIAKPSEITPMTAFLLAEICKEAGLPDGVLNILHGLGGKVGKSIIKHPKIKAISFTGSTKIGREIASIVSPMFKKLSLELGGKNPAVVFADCDYEKTLQGVLRSAFTNQGQICLCSERILIEKSIYQRFKNDLVEATKKLKVGNPLDENTQQGAVVSATHFQKVLNCIEIAKNEGGTILCGGEALKMEGENAKGLFIKPTLIEGLGNETRTNQEEIFGAVATLIPFEDENQAIELANDTNYGLSASVWTENIGKAHRVAQKIDAGIVWVNSWLVRDLRTPFGGMKDSGMGREGGWDALNFCTEPKNIGVKI
jgi:aminomuconate-semialdehyde/2-hydroxymuconate-6-semialdehyde dehydrogenase